MIDRTGGFRRIDSTSLAEQAMPRATARRLRLAQAWREVAGAGLARRAETLRVARGILDVRVTDERWRRALGQLLPALIARLGFAHPELRIRRYRICVAPEEPRGRSLPIPDAGQLPALPPRAAAIRPAPRPSVESSDSTVRSLAQRYLERAGTRADRES